MASDFQGLIQVYTGDGKGKTTAALGLALRASGQGMRVVFIQFLKGQPGGEHLFAEKCGAFEIVQFGKGDLFKKSKEELAKETRQAFSFAESALTSSKYDVVVLDEIFVAYGRGFLTRQEIFSLMEMKPPAVELVMTGRDAPSEVIKRADLVTEMLMIKHPYAAGVSQRKGIEY